MNRQRFLIALASVFAGITVLLAMLGIVYNLVIVVFAVPFGLAAYVLWYHATGRLEARTRRRRADPRQRARGDPRFNGGRNRQTSQLGPGSPSGDLSAREAYRRLDLEPGADEEAVRRAYRRKVKEVHPDREGGDEQAFREVRKAYDRLSEGQ